MKIEKSGYGAGSREFPGHANVVRLTVGETASTLAAKTALETLTVLEANLDDLNPQVFGYVMDRLLEEATVHDDFAGAESFAAAAKRCDRRPPTDTSS